MAGSYSATASGGGTAAGGGAGGGPGGSWGIPCPDSVAFGSPFQLVPSLSGTYCSSLSHILTVGARLPGTVAHGVLRAPRTATRWSPAGPGSTHPLRGDRGSPAVQPDGVAGQADTRWCTAAAG